MFTTVLRRIKERRDHAEFQRVMGAAEPRVRDELRVVWQRRV